MSTILIIVAVAVVIGLFSYFTNAGLGDRRPKPPAPTTTTKSDDAPN